MLGPLDLGSMFFSQKDNRSEHAASKDGRFESRPHENVQSRAHDRSSEHARTKFRDQNTVTPSVSSNYVK